MEKVGQILTSVQGSQLLRMAPPGPPRQVKLTGMLGRLTDTA